MLQNHFYTNFVKLKEIYLRNKPFNHLIIDDFLQNDYYNNAYRGFDLDCEDTIDYTHASQSKRGLTNIKKMKTGIQNLIKFFSSDKFLKNLGELTNIKNLKFDQSLHGGGLHEVKKGGFLNIHKDFGTHPNERTWKRRINLLVYFNEVWKEEWNGQLELWENDKSSCSVKINPIKNRAVIFDVNGSYHGHPEPLNCPDHVKRKSLALYYFTDEGVNQRTISTYYTARPDDSISYKIKIFFDRQLIKIYSFLKRYFNISDKSIEKFLIFFFKKKK